MFKKLVVISHTEHQLDSRFGPVGWGPTVREIDYLASHWEEVIHIACLDKRQPLGSSIPYTSARVRFVPIPTFGGKRWYQKIDIIYKSPYIIWQVHKALKASTQVQVRLPMGLGLILLIYFKLIGVTSPRVWIKYATNWIVPSKSFSYRLQHKLLKKNWLACPVTINGIWPDQPAHCFSFENPCLTQLQYKNGEAALASKKIEGPVSLIFVGTLDENKGIDILIDSFNSLHWDKISALHIVGEGPFLRKLKESAAADNLPIILHGTLTQEAIFKLMEICHFLILPSKSEGFPKVVAEGLNFGCIPIVTGVGSIPQYIRNKENGFIIPSSDASVLSELVNNTIRLDSQSYMNMMVEGRLLAKRFTFEDYFKQLQTEVLNVI